MKAFRISASWLLLLASLATSPGSALAQQDPAADPMPELLNRLGDVEGRIGYLQMRRDSAVGEDVELFEDQLTRRWREHHALLGELVAATQKAREDGSEKPDVTERVRAALEQEFGSITRRAEHLDERIRQLRVARPDTPAAQLFDLEVKLTELNAALDELIGAAAADIEWADVVSAELGPDVGLFDHRLADRAATIAARIELARDQRAALVRRSAKAGADTVTIQEEIDALDEKLHGTTMSLQSLVRVLETRNLPTDGYRRLLLETTGDIGEDILNPNVVGGVVADRWQKILDWLRQNSAGILVKLATILLVLFVFGILARLSRRLVQRALSASPVETTELLRRLLVGIAAKLVWLLGLLVVLSVVGVDVGPMLAGLGIAGFVLGFALQDTLSNFAAGLMIMFYHPFDVGDYVTAGGVKGVVHSVSLVSTVITTPDNQVMVVPNNKVWGDVINNVTAQDKRRVDLTFGIGYGDDIPKARAILEDILKSHDLVLDEPESVVRVHELGDSSVNFVCRPWCRTEDYWTVYWDVTEAVKQRFDAEGVSIPFPQRDVDIHQVGGTDDA